MLLLFLLYVNDFIKYIRVHQRINMKISVCFSFTILLTCCYARPKLYEVDTYIVKLLLEPASHEGDELLSSINLYNKILREIADKYVHNDETVFKIATIVYNRNGPRFLTKRYSDALLRETFNWDMQTFDRLRNLLAETKEIYAQFRETYETINNIQRPRTL